FLAQVRDGGPGHGLVTGQRAGKGTGRGGACPSARTSPPASLGCPPVPKPKPLTGSQLAEATVELPVVLAVHIAVAVEVEVPQVTGLTGALLERRPEQVAVQPVHVAVAVAVAEQSEEAVHPVAARGAVAVAVQLPPPAVVDVVREDRQ